MTFSTKVSGTDTAAERMRIHTDGSIGIGTNSPSEKLEVYPDTNISAIFGRAHIGHMGHSDWAGFSHVDMNATGSYGLLQSSTGITLLNAADTKYIDFRLNNVSKMKLNSLPNIVFYHGIVASAFAIVFLLEAFGVALPSLSLKGQHPNFVTSEYTKAVCLFAAVGIGIFAVYEIFFRPS